MDPAGPESIVFVYIFLQFLPNKDGSGILQLGQKNFNIFFKKKNFKIFFKKKEFKIFQKKNQNFFKKKKFKNFSNFFKEFLFEN